MDLNRIQWDGTPKDFIYMDNCYLSIAGKIVTVDSFKNLESVGGITIHDSTIDAEAFKKLKSITKGGLVMVNCERVSSNSFPVLTNIKGRSSFEKSQILKGALPALKWVEDFGFAGLTKESIAALNPELRKCLEELYKKEKAKAVSVAAAVSQIQR